MQDLNPAVERAVHRAGSSATSAEWLRILLADDEGRPAMLAAKIGLSSAVILTQLEGVTGRAMPTDDVLQHARQQAIRLRADPDLTTDILLVAVLVEDPILGEALGFTRHRLEEAVRSPMLEAAAPMPTREVTFDPPDVTDRHDAARVVDANLNRARESLRVLDDYARFVINDPTLTQSLKTMRHTLSEWSALLPLPALLAARDTPGDLGTAITTRGEYDRASPRHVAHVNAKRLQEALRSIEEYGKILNPLLSREVEALRYESYSLERALFGGSNLRERLAEAKLYLLVSGAGCTASLEWTIAEAAAGGASIVQLREKGLSDRELLARARQVREWTRQAKVLFLINDRPDIARLCDADGVHLGQDDCTLPDARRILGPQPLIGISTHNLAQVHRAVQDGADYLGIGPCFPSSTKPFEELAGPPFITAAMPATALPMFALGGIHARTIEAAVQAGATRVAVGAAICQADEPRLAAAHLIASL